MADGEAIDEVYMVADKQLRTNRQGNLFLQLELRDRTGSISARMWNASEAQFRSFEDGELLRVKGKVQLYQGALQIIFTGFDRVPTGQLNLAPASGGSGQGPGRYSPVFAAADRACRHLLPAGVPDNGTGP